MQVLNRISSSYYFLFYLEVRERTRIYSVNFEILEYIGIPENFGTAKKFNDKVDRRVKFLVIPRFSGVALPLQLYRNYYIAILCIMNETTRFARNMYIL